MHIYIDCLLFGENILYALNFAIVPSTRRDLAVDASTDSNVSSDSRSAFGMDCGMAVMYSLGDAGPGTFYTEESGQDCGRQETKKNPTKIGAVATLRKNELEKIVAGMSLLHLQSMSDMCEHR